MSVQALLQTGSELGGYRVDGVLGSGGMGVVYEATQLSLDRTVALKVIAAHHAADPAFRERFRREAMLQAALEHPNVVTVYEAGESEGSLYLAMRLVRGTDLKRMILEDRLHPSRVLTILEQVASALDAAHEAGLIHRDVKPQNVLVAEDDHAYLGDFGLIKHHEDPAATGGRGVGTLDYLPPEQIRGEQLGPQSDVYALAAVLYECLAGQVPFPGETEAATLYAHVSAPPPRLGERRPDLPPGLDAVIAQGLAKRPEERQSSASQLVQEARRQFALDRVLETARGDTPPPVVEPPPAADEPAPDEREDPRERFGETLADPAVLRQAPVIEVQPERRASRLLIAVLIALLALASLGGWLVGRSTDKVEHHPTGVAVGGLLALTFPSDDWRPSTSATGLPGLSLADPIALASTDSGGGGELVAGVAESGEGPLLLPDALVAKLRERPRRESVRLGAQPAFRYRRLRLEDSVGPLTVYVVPTDRGVATIACRASAGSGIPVEVAATALGECESIATSLVLRGATPLGLRATPAFARTAKDVLTTLNAKRTRARGALLAAGTRVDQARAAEELAAAFRTAATTLGKPTPGPLERPNARIILIQLQVAAASYTALGAAARRNDRRDYNRAAFAIRRAEGALQRAVLDLARAT